MSVRRMLCCLAAASVLAACDEGPASNLSFTATEDVWSYVTNAAAAGPLQIEVHGNPFPEPDPFVHREFAQAVGNAFTEPWLRFSAATGSSDFRLVWLLDPGEGFDHDRACAGELPAVGTRGRTLEIRAVLCHRERPLTAVHGWMRHPESAADPGLRNLISQMGRQLLTGRG
ncbi:MAG TPA: hypothetical protein VF342_15010 [Alphaproteobacteria bacterium]